jgi:3-hydroxyacyl-CoA dehydrogenase/enoyl-CoA hydratase/carnithine racemase
MAEFVTQFYVNTYDSPLGKIALLTMDNGEDYRKPNTLGGQALGNLNRALDLIEADRDIQALVLTGKPYIFCVGADLTEAGVIHRPEDAVEAGRVGHATFKRIMDLPCVTVAGINGACIGGGLEIALYCQYRTISSGATAVAFPECFLGLVPAWGGTQLTPRLIGMENAIQLIITNPLNQNRMIDGRKAFELGLADRLFEPVEFLDDTLKFAIDLLEDPHKVDRKPVYNTDAKKSLEEARTFVWDRVREAAIAPPQALELMEGSLIWDLDTGFERENQALGVLATSRQFKASVYSFDLVQRRVKRQVGRPGAQPLPIFKIGLIGAGLMASQLAVLFLRRLGIPVVMKDIKQDLLDKGTGYVRGELARLAKKGRMDQSKADNLFRLVHTTLDYAAFSDCDLVVEAVFEEMALKQKVFAELEGVVRDQCILATNTSSLSVTEMGSKLKHPERAVGLHFFNPVALMPLLEIIRTEKTSDATLATGFEISKRLKKSGVMVKDSPGFLVNRLLSAWMKVPMMAVDGGNTFVEADEAIRSLGMPMGPFTLIGFVGPAVALHVNRVMNKALGDRFPVSENLVRFVEAGKKSFYTFTERGIEMDPEALALWQQADPPRKLSKDEIIQQTLEEVCIECDLMLKEGVIGSPKDIDTGMLMGAGWPFFLGGITMYLDQMSISGRILGGSFHE